MINKSPKFEKCGEIRIQDQNDPPSFVYIAASSSTSKGVTSTSDSQIYYFDSAEAKVIYNFKAHDTDISGICMSERSQIIGSCSTDEGNKGNEVSLWDMRTSNLIGTFSCIAYDNKATTCNCVAISRNGTIVAAGANSGVLCWDVRKPEAAFRNVSLQPDEISSIEFHPFTDSTFLAGDDDGNILLYDLDGANIEDSMLFYGNDGNPCFQCGFCGIENIFTLRRTAGLRLWNIFEPEIEKEYFDVRVFVDNAFTYPIDAHWCGQHLMLVGGDSEGGVALVLCNQENATLLHKIEKAHDDCVDASFLDTQEDGSIHLYLAGDGGQLSFWHILPDEV
ncbi:WD repeat-containing protein 89 [Tritrichomonas musculus]|uniref:WD repeat-containing protein 89 n=1 Tax=Tritrichomonas musculus TaxID=1915356 RepID=A0ABR2GV70_9EUKA